MHRTQLTTADFIARAREIHGDKYDYSKTKYSNRKSKVTIICPKHGIFKQAAYSHLRGCGCKKCSNKNKLTTEEFIKKAKDIHGNKYDYSKTKYKSYSSKVI